MGCPEVDYGIPTDGATEYSVSSGRELFQCGADCVKMYIVNVSVETSTVTMSCADINDAVTADVCLRSGNVSLQDQNIVNWIAKDGVSTDLDNGYVINRAADCGSGGDTAIYTHTDGQLAARVTAKIDQVVSGRDNIKEAVKNKIADVCKGQVEEMINVVDFIFSDVNTDASPTDWQGGGVTYQAFGQADNGGTRTARGSFNWQNGQAECREGEIEYDETSSPQDLGSIINSMIQ